jgi:hypothetical protein
MGCDYRQMDRIIKCRITSMQSLPQHLFAGCKAGSRVQRACERFVSVFESRSGRSSHSLTIQGCQISERNNHCETTDGGPVISSADNPNTYRDASCIDWLSLCPGRGWLR